MRAVTECAICKHLPGATHVCPELGHDEVINTKTGERFTVTAIPGRSWSWPPEKPGPST